MKVLFSLPYYAPAYSYGGPVANSERLAYGLLEKGVEVSVITTDALDAENRNPVLQENLNGVNVFRLMNVSNTLSKQANLYAPRKLKKWLTDNIANYDLVHIQDVFAFLMTMPVMDAAIREKVPFIIQPRGMLNDDCLENSGIIKPIKRFLIKRYLPRFEKASAFVALTSVGYHSISHYYDPNKIDIIPNGIDLPDFSELEPLNIRKKLGLSKEIKVIIYIGRIHWIKGIDISLKVLAGVKNKADFHFVVIGPHERNELSRLTNLTKQLSLEDKVSFIGPVYGDDKYRYLKGADLFMSLSRAEGQGITSVEALACGVPVFLSESAGIEEYNDYNVNKVVNINRIEEAQNKLIKLLNEPDTLLDMKKNTRRTVKELFGRQLMVDKFYDLYKRILT